MSEALIISLGMAFVAVGAVTCTALVLRSPRYRGQVVFEAAAQAEQVASAEREAAVRSAIETVLQLAGDKFDDHQEAAARELDLRSRTIAEQVSGLSRSFEHQVGGMNRAFELQLSGMNDELRRVGDLVDVLQRDRASQHSQVVESIQATARQTATLSSATQGLREALANSRARGQWGERMADDVLRAAGFVEGVNYRKQVSLSGGSRPDITFLLPNDRMLHMDVKFPIDNYLRYVDTVRDAPDSPAAMPHRAQFLKDVRQRVKEITSREYVDPTSTLGYVLLFIPNEAVYGFVHENDPELLDIAMGQGVVLCSPFTLFAVLGVVRQAVESVQLQRTSDEILGCLASFTAQWTKFSESVDTLGKRFESAHKAFDEMSGTRRRQMQRTLDEVVRLREARGFALPSPGEVTEQAESSSLVPGQSGPERAASDFEHLTAEVIARDAADDRDSINASTEHDDPTDIASVGSSALAAVVGGEPSRPDQALSAGHRVPRLRPIRGR